LTDDDNPADATDDDGPDLAAPPDTASGRRRVERKAERLRREQRESDAFWRAIFADPVGRREMWRLLATLHPFEERFAVGPNGFPQVEATWFHAGEQSFGCRLHRSWFKRDPQGVMRMHAEHDPDFAQPKRRSAEPE
jgi:hypothetical protein